MRSRTWHSTTKMADNPANAAMTAARTCHGERGMVTGQNPKTFSTGGFSPAPGVSSAMKIRLLANHGIAAIARSELTMRRRFRRDRDIPSLDANSRTFRPYAKPHSAKAGRRTNLAIQRSMSLPTAMQPQSADTSQSPADRLPAPLRVHPRQSGDSAAPRVTRRTPHTTARCRLRPGSAGLQQSR